MIALLVLLVLFTMVGCSDRDRHKGAERARPVAQPSAATLANCHMMYPKQPDLEQACIMRWTSGEEMPGPSTPPPQDDGTIINYDSLVQWCAGLAGIPPVHQETHRVTSAELLRIGECLDQRLRR
jgi:hypothetical protein